MLFEKNTFTLKKWIVFTNEVNKTEVLLENIRLNVNIQNKIFQIDESDPKTSYMERLLKDHRFKF